MLKEEVALKLPDGSTASIAGPVSETPCMRVKNTLITAGLMYRLPW